MNQQTNETTARNARHICTQPEKHPKDFFITSPFGKSIAYKTNTQDSEENPPKSNLNVNRFAELGFLQGFQETLRKGLPLLLHEIPQKRAMINHPSTTDPENLEFIKDAMEKWEKAEIFGYTEEIPHLVNSLKVVTKGTKRRLVLDARSSGLNENILVPKFALPQMSEIVNMIEDGGWMMKADFANGFLQLPINQREQTYLGFLHPVNKRYCKLQRLPFGIASAPFLFQTFTTFLQEGIERLLGFKTGVYIDDWFLTEINREKLIRKFTSFKNLLELLGVGLQESKTEGPTKRMIYLGLGIDTERHVLFLPEEKRKRYLDSLCKLLEQKTLSMEEVAKTAGRLVHISAIHKEGLGHVQALWNVMYSERTAWTKRELTAKILTIEEDLKGCLLW